MHDPQVLILLAAVLAALCWAATCGADLQDAVSADCGSQDGTSRREALAHPDGAHDGECIPAERAPGHSLHIE